MIRRSKRSEDRRQGWRRYVPIRVYSCPFVDRPVALLRAPSCSSWIRPSAAFARFVALLLLTTTGLLAAEPAPPKPVEVKLVGRMVCVACELKLKYDAPNDCATTGHRFGFLAEDGDLFTLLETDRTRPLIKGEKYAYQLVQIQGLRYPRSMVLEVREIAPAPPGAAKAAGQKVYYCTTCAITMYMPGPCFCCGEPVAEVKK